MWGSPVEARVRAVWYFELTTRSTKGQPGAPSAKVHRRGETAAPAQLLPNSCLLQAEKMSPGFQGMTGTIATRAQQRIACTSGGMALSPTQDPARS